MSWLVRITVIMLLALALPLQGVAAATMACHSVPSGDPAAIAGAQAEHQHGTHSGIHHPLQAADAHAAIAAQAAGSVDASAATDSPAGVGADPFHSCSNCAGCCSAAAIMQVPLALQQAAAAPTLFATVVPDVARFVAIGPERPPRILVV